MALSSKVVQLIRLNLLNNACEAARICHISIVEDELPVLGVWILIQMVDAVRVEEGGSPFDPMHFISLVQEELRHVSAVLARNTGNQSNLLHFVFPYYQNRAMLPRASYGTRFLDHSKQTKRHQATKQECKPLLNP